MLQRSSARRRIIGFAVFVFIAAAVFGVPVADSLSPEVSKIRDRSRTSASGVTIKFGRAVRS